MKVPGNTLEGGGVPPFCYTLQSAVVYLVMQGGNPGSGADLRQPDLQLFPRHAPVLLSVPCPVAGLHPSASDRTSDSVRASARPDSRCPAVGGFVLAVCCSVRRRHRVITIATQGN